MASSRYLMDHMDILNESEDSDQEYIPLAGGYSNNVIEDLLCEIDVARYYKKLTENLLSRPVKSSATAPKSKAVQTEAELRGIPPSWFIAGQKLVSELHTGLANMMNTLYHTPNGYCKDGGMTLKTDPNRLKHFKYVDGCWQSKLLPHIKIPACGLDRQVNSEDFKRELNSLLEKASRLKDIIPYVAEFDVEAKLQIAESEKKSCESKNLPTAETENTKEACGDAGYVMPHVAASSSCSRIPRLVDSNSGNFPETSDTDSVKSGYSSQSGTCGWKFNTNNTKKELPQKIPNKDVRSGGSESKHNHGVAVSRYHLSSRECRFVQLPIPKPSAPQKASKQHVESEYNIKSDSGAGSGLILVGGKVSNNHRKPLSPVIESGTSSDYPSTSGNNVLKAGKSVRVKSPSCVSNVAPATENASNDHPSTSGNNVFKAGKSVGVKSSSCVCKMNGISEQENSSKVRTASYAGKNFIQRNILASRVPVIRLPTDRFKHGHMKI